MEKLRKNYLKLLIQTLKDNVKNTSTLNLDDMTMLHFGMSIEERCFDKNRDIAAYTRAITVARLKIEQNTSEKRLFPMIAECMHVKDNEMVSTVKNNNAAKISTTTYGDPANIEMAKRHKVDNNIIEISSDSDDDDEYNLTKQNINSESSADDVIDLDAYVYNNKNHENTDTTEILMSVQTISRNENKK